MEVSHKARKIIEAEISNRPGDSAAALYIVLALDRAGLLAPDTPEPDEQGKSGQFHMAEWLPLGTGLENPIVWTAAGAGRVMIQRIEPGELTPEGTRKVALALLAAANYAEEEQPNGNV